MALLRTLRKAELGPAIAWHLTKTCEGLWLAGSQEKPPNHDTPWVLVGTAKHSARLPWYWHDNRLGLTRAAEKCIRSNLFRE
jgi:hypothetical protein